MKKKLHNLRPRKGVQQTQVFVGYHVMSLPLMLFKMYVLVVIKCLNEIPFV